jgi:hypothetical protein
VQSLHGGINFHVHIRGAPRMLPSVDAVVGADWALARLDRCLADAQQPRSPHHRHPLLAEIASADLPVGQRVAVDWLDRVGHRFPDGHLYVDLRGRADPVAGGLRVLLDAFGVQLGPDADIEELSAAWRTATAHRWVAVVVVGAPTRRHLYKPFLSASEHSATLLVSEETIPGLATHGGELIDLDGDDAACRARQRGIESPLNDRDWLQRVRVGQHWTIRRIMHNADAPVESVQTALSDIGLEDPLASAEQQMAATRGQIPEPITTSSPLYRLRINVGIIGALENAKITKVGQLLQWANHQRLTTLNGIGPYRVTLIHAALERAGFDLEISQDPGRARQ